MEELISISGLSENDLIFLAGCLVILFATLLISIFTKDRVPEKETELGKVEEPSQLDSEIEGESVDATSSIEQAESIEINIIEQTEQSDESANITEIPEVDTQHQETQIQQFETPITEDISPINEATVEVEKNVENSTEFPEDEKVEQSLFSRLRNGLSKTHTGFIGKLDTILNKKEINEETWDEFEEALVMADLGVSTTMKLREELEKNIQKNAISDPKEIKINLKKIILDILSRAEGNISLNDNKPFVMIVAGVNGVGKTTTIGKLAYKFKNEGKRVMVAAADTFRAAAVDQLEIWANRVGSEFIRGKSGADPSAVAFDAVKSSIAKNIDVLIIDTAGRLHTKANLMDELKKLRRIIGREIENAPHETILVLDATTGQNAVQQAKMFKEAIEVSGIALTKLDGTAKGGVIVSIANELNIPVKYIGIGESLKDLREFNAEEFVEALFLSESDTIH